MQRRQTQHLVDLAPGWALWRDFAVRSTGFAVDGLSAFGGGDESARLAAVARDPRFREAVGWQSRESLARAVDKHGLGVPESPSRVRRREEVIASYWQRYCGKNDTIGFFGPLGWGQLSDDVPGVVLRAGAPDRERAVHLENWAVEAVGRAAGVEPLVPMGPFPERDLRRRLEAQAPAGLAELDRLEAARDAVACAPRDEVEAALDALDAVFEDVAGRPAVRGAGDSGGGRTAAYLDCRSDLDLRVGGAVLDELRLVLPAVLEASRWWNGRVFARGAALMQRMVAGRPGPLGPLVGELMGAAFGLYAQLGEEQRELRQRWAAVVGDGSDLGGLAARAAAEFDDAGPAWHGSVYHSVDVQLAAPDAQAIGRGEFLAVLGDFHGGDNPLLQGLFVHRAPDPAAMLQWVAEEAGPGVHLLPPRHGVVNMTARAYPVYGVPGDIVVTTGEEPAPPSTRAVSVRDVVVDGDGMARDRGGAFCVPLAELLFLPLFVSAIRTFDLAGGAEGARVTLGRLVIQRAKWSASAAELPDAADDLAAWGARRGLPRAVFARTPQERKPIYVDFTSPALRRVLARRAAVARADGADAVLEFSEVLPGPQDCWLASPLGRHTSELRLVAVAR